MQRNSKQTFPLIQAHLYHTVDLREPRSFSEKRSVHIRLGGGVQLHQPCLPCGSAFEALFMHASFSQTARMRAGATNHVRRRLTTSNIASSAGGVTGQSAWLSCSLNDRIPYRIGNTDYMKCVTRRQINQLLRTTLTCVLV